MCKIKLATSGEMKSFYVLFTRLYRMIQLGLRQLTGTGEKTKKLGRAEKNLLLERSCCCTHEALAL